MALLGGVCLALMAGVLTVTAAVSGAVNPVTSYATYPPALPGSCAADGSSILNNVQFASSGQTAGSLGG